MNKPERSKPLDFLGVMKEKKRSGQFEKNFFR